MPRGVETCLNVRTLRKGELVLFCLLHRVDRTCCQQVQWRVARWRTTGALNGVSLVKVSDVFLEGGSLLFRDDGGLSCRRFASGAYLGGPLSWAPFGLFPSA